MALRNFLQELAPLIRLSTLCNRGAKVSGHVLLFRCTCITARAYTSSLQQTRFGCVSYACSKNYLFVPRNFKDFFATQGPVGAVDLLRQPMVRLATSAAQLVSTPATEGREGPTNDAHPTNETAEPSGGPMRKDVDVQGVAPSSGSGGQVAGAPAVGKYQWNKERTEREIRRAKFARDEVSRLITELFPGYS